MERSASVLMLKTVLLSEASSVLVRRCLWARADGHLCRGVGRNWSWRSSKSARAEAESPPKGVVKCLDC